MSPQSDALPLPVVGARARLRRRVERFPHFLVEAGAIGTTMATEKLIAMKMHALVSGAEEWGNEVCWTPEEGEAIAGPDATAEQTISGPSTSIGTTAGGSAWSSLRRPVSYRIESSTSAPDRPSDSRGYPAGDRGNAP